jgi:hypothetical protein
VAFGGETAELIIGIDGFTGTKNHAIVTPSQLLTAENVTYENGTLQKEGGAAKYNSSAISGAPTIQGGFDWHPVDGTQRMVVLLSDGDLKKDTGGGDFTVDLATGLTVSDVVGVFVAGGKEAAANNRKLFLFTGKNAVQVLAADGATTAALSTPPSDWSGSNQPITGAIHENRLWGAGNANDPHRVYASLPTDHENFTGTALSLAIYPGEGTKIVQILSFKGLLIVFKYPNGIYLVDTSDSDTAKWRVIKHSTSIGGVSPLGAVQIDDDILFIDHTGSFHVISAIEQFGNIGSRNLSDIAQFDVFMREDCNLAELPRTQAIYYVAKRQAMFAASSSGTLYDRKYIVDFNRPDIPRFTISTKDTNRSIWLRVDASGIARPTTGDNSGFVWNLDQSARSKDGAGYNGKFQTPHLDMSHLDPALGIRNKNGKFLELVVEPTGNWDLSVDILWDDVIEETVTFNMGTSGSTLGSFVLGTDKLAGSNLVNKRRRIHGSGRRFSIIGRNSGDGQDFSIAKFYLLFNRGADPSD